MYFILHHEHTPKSSLFVPLFTWKPLESVSFYYSLEEEEGDENDSDEELCRQDEVDLADEGQPNVLVRE